MTTTTAERPVRDRWGNVYAHRTARLRECVESLTSAVEVTGADRMTPAQRADVEQAHAALAAILAGGAQ